MLFRSTEADRQTMHNKVEAGSKARTGYSNPGNQPPTLTANASTAAAAPGTTVKNAYIPMDMQIAKTHLADVTAEQMRRGYVDYGQAAGLMLRASQESSKPWVTVRDLAHAAVGAGAGAVAGTAAAKGIGMFVNMSPTEQRIMQGTGAALGALLNLGKFSF